MPGGSTFEKGNSCIKLQKRTRLKLRQEHNLFYLPCSVLQLKMTSNSVKLDIAKNWHRRLGHLNQTDVVRNTTTTSGNSMTYLVSSLWPRWQGLQSQEWLSPKKKRKWKVCSQTWWDLSEKNHCQCSGFAMCLRTSALILSVDLLKAMSKALTRLKEFVLSVGRPRSLGKIMRNGSFHSGSKCSA